MNDTESGEAEAVEQLESEADDVSELKETVRKLEAELGKYRRAEDRQAERNKGLMRWGLKTLIGPELQDSSRAWFAKFAEPRTSRELVSSPESADFFTAILRRVVRIGAFGLAAFVLTGLVPLATVWLLSRQVSLQASDNLIVRRAQLLDTIYEEECREVAPEAEAPPEKVCVPRAHARARHEAIAAFVKIENGQGARVNLETADLRRVDFSGANLHHAKLDGANLHHAKLEGANLENANLKGAVLKVASLSGANLDGANLKDANLQRAFLLGAALESADLTGADLRRAVLNSADLTGAYLWGAKLKDADLTGADLTGANLQNADLKGAKNLLQFQVNAAKGNSRTTLPDHLERPDHWSDK